MTKAAYSDNEAIFRRKAQRIARGEKPRTLDLFSGCGGLSLGFLSAGFEITANVEFDPDAAASHAANFHPANVKYALPKDITQTSSEELVIQLGLKSVAESIDVIVGGPPCQAFARVGRSKLREIQEHPEAFIHDPRASLYLHYLEYVEQFKPLALLVENVPDVLNHGGQNIAQEIAEALDDLGYTTRYTLLNAAYYGVPQMRERMFLMAFRHELNQDVEFPYPTHWIDLPSGYEGSRQVALKNLKKNRIDAKDALYSHYVDPPIPSPQLKIAVTAEEALSDLPKITEHLEGLMKKGARRFDNLIPYEDLKISSYAKMLREWPGFENTIGLKDHVTRCLPRDWDIFRRMNPGDQYPEAYQHAVEIFNEKIFLLKAQGRLIVEYDSLWLAIWKSTVPPYDVSKFPNKWRKMEADKPARTLMAHLGKDGYSHIHYDSTQARTISVREAARLQSFPDGFIFRGTMNPAFRQIGNAVPPVMAKALAEAMLKKIKLGVVEPELRQQQLALSF